MNKINWYPGHMAKARRLLAEQLSRVDLVVELCDARLPYSSRNPDLDRMLGGRKRILLLNKADLADPAVTSRWLKHFRNGGETVDAVDSRHLKTADVIRLIEKGTREAVERAAARGMKKTVRVMIAGVPNVGKSTFINRLRGSGIAETGDKPGVTKSQQWVKISPWMELLDTPGLLWPRLEDQIAARRLCYLGAVRDEVVDQEELALRLLEELAEIRPDSLRDRFHANPDLRGEALLESVCRGRGFLLKGSVPDYTRGCAVALDEFRAGRLGRITLEEPEIPGKAERQGSSDESGREVPEPDRV